MKTIISILSAMFMAQIMSAANVTIAWDASPVSVTNYTVRWIKTGDTAVNTRVVGQALTTTLSLGPGQWSVTATATSAQGIESDPSNVLVIDVPPAPVIRLNLQGAATVEGPWTNIVTLENIPLGNETAFYRGLLEVSR